MKMDLKNVDLIVKDGAGNQLIFTNRLPRKMPKNSRSVDRARERVGRVGGCARTTRLKRKKRAALIRAWIFATNIIGNISWGEDYA